MPRFAKLAEKSAKVIAEKIGQDLQALLPEAHEFMGAPTEFAFDPTFEEWVLPGKRIVGSRENDLGSMAQPTGRCVHNIKAGRRGEPGFLGEPVAYARSAPYGIDAESWSVVEVTRSDVAKRLNAAVEWTRQNLPAESEVRFLVVPVYQLFALWILSDTNDQSVLIVAAPPEYGDSEGFRLYDVDGFLEVLRSLPRSMGLTD